MNQILELLAKAKWFTESLQAFQTIAPIGLGNTFADVIATGLVLQELGAQEGHPRGELLEQPCYFSHAISRWHRGGAPRFRLTHSFATQLALTDPDGIDSAEVRFPFDTFLIELPFPRGPLVFDDLDGPRDALCILVNVTYNSTDLITVPRYRDAGRLKTNGWVEKHGSTFVATDAGVEALGGVDPLPTGEDLRQYWLEWSGNGGQRRMLEAILEAGEDGITRGDAADAADLASNAGTFATYLGRLRTANLVETVTRHGVQCLRATEELR